MFRRFTPFLLAVCALGIFTAAAQAETQGPVWKIIAAPNPTNFKPGAQPGVDMIVVEAVNVGGASTDGSPVTISDSLPTGLTAVEVEKFGRNYGIAGLDTYRKAFSEFPQSNASNMHCSPTSAPAPSCTESDRVDPGDTLILSIPVSVAMGPSTITNVATVTGGGAASASVSTPVTIGSALPAYGVAEGGLLAASSTSQAGAHPNVTTAFILNTVNSLNFGDEEFAAGATPVVEPKDVGFDLPPGLVGSTVGMPRCTMADVANESDCPRDTMVGTSTVIVNQDAGVGGLGRIETTVPVFNIAPAPGEPAAFAFNTVYFPVRLDTSVLSDGDYGVRVSGPDINQASGVIADAVTIWGVPADHSGPGPDFALVAGLESEENEARTKPPEPPETAGWRSFGGPAVEEVPGSNGTIEKTAYQTRAALLTNPSQCSSRLEASLSTDSWEAPGVFAEQSTVMGAGTGCDLLSFDPSVSMLPDTLEAGAPAGYSLDLSVPQNSEPEGLATPDVKRVVATLPLGTVISPSAADGLGIARANSLGCILVCRVGVRVIRRSGRCGSRRRRLKNR